jgi:hypothetical protein
MLSSFLPICISVVLGCIGGYTRSTVCYLLTGFVLVGLRKIKGNEEVILSHMTRTDFYPEHQAQMAVSHAAPLGHGTPKESSPNYSKKL